MLKHHSDLIRIIFLVVMAMALFYYVMNAFSLAKVFADSFFIGEFVSDEEEVITYIRWWSIGLFFLVVLHLIGVLMSLTSGDKAVNQLTSIIGIGMVVILLAALIISFIYIKTESGMEDEGFALINSFQAGIAQIFVAGLILSIGTFSKLFINKNGEND